MSNFRKKQAKKRNKSKSKSRKGAKGKNNKLKVRNKKKRKRKRIGFRPISGAKNTHKTMKKFRDGGNFFGK